MDLNSCGIFVYRRPSAFINFSAGGCREVSAEEMCDFMAGALKYQQKVDFVLPAKIELIELKDKILKSNQKVSIKRGGIFNIELGKFHLYLLKIQNLHGIIN